MGRFFNIALSIFVASGSFLFGYDAGVMTDVIASEHFQDYFNTQGKTSPVIGAINSTFNGGAVFGALMGGFTMDSLGRKKTLQIGALICLVGAVLQTAAVNLAMILIGRIMAGWAVGLLSMAVPVYQSECAHPKIRGLIVGFAQQMIGVGFIVSTWIGYGAHHAGYSAFQWRFPLAFQTVPCIALIVGMFFLPESPRHLIATDRDDEGLRVLKKLHYNGQNGDWIDEEFNEIKQTIAAEKAITVPGWAIMFKQPQWRTRLMHGVLVQVFTQLSGINVIGYYQIIMYEALGITGSRALLVAGIYNCVGPIANLIFILFIVDRIGRRKPLLFGAAGITIALICEAAINSQNEDGSKRGLSIAGVAFLFLVSIIFSLSFGPVSWIYMSEVMPMQIRARGNAFATGIGNWLVATIFAQASPEGLGKLGWKFYFVFVAFNIVVTIPVVFFFFKETKQLSLEDVDLLFGERALGTLPENLHKEEHGVTEIEQTKV